MVFWNDFWDIWGHGKHPKKSSTSRCSELLSNSMKHGNETQRVHQTMPNPHLACTCIEPIPLDASALAAMQEHRWNGISFGPKLVPKSGYFPPSAVHLIENQVSMHHFGNQKQAKKCPIPVVPDEQPIVSPYATRKNYSVKFKSDCDNAVILANTAPGVCGTSKTDCNCNIYLDTRVKGLSVAPASNAMNDQEKALPLVNSGIKTRPPHSANSNQVQVSTDSGGHRNSTSSSTSDASSGFESMKSSVAKNQKPAKITESRNSMHSSESSSLGNSLERLDESGYASQINVSDMITSGTRDEEIVTAWLRDLQYEHYASLFLNAGYDLPTIARMTPEDLTAIGITKPGHRKRLTAEIHKLNLQDNWPSKIPAGGLEEWLTTLHLISYLEVFESQNFCTVKDVLGLTWEDFEDIGIKKLGHLKKLELACKKLNHSKEIDGAATPLVEMVTSPNSKESSLKGSPDSTVPPIPPGPSYLSTFAPCQSDSSINNNTYLNALASKVKHDNMDKSVGTRLLCY